MNMREQYLAKLKAQLDEWNAELSRWDAKARSGQADMRIEYEKQIDALRRQRDQALEQMRKVQAATGDTWRDLVRGADDAWAKMREAIERANTHLRK